MMIWRGASAESGQARQARLPITPHALDGELIRMKFLKFLPKSFIPPCSFEILGQKLQYWRFPWRFVEGLQNKGRF